MTKYHKIQTVYKRDPKTNYKHLIQGEYSLPEFEYLQDAEWVFTEKIDGTNIRVMYNDGVVTFGGRTDRAQIPAKLLTNLQETFTPNAMNNTFRDIENVVLYGEGFGAGIQRVGKKYGLIQRFVLFDVLIGRWWLTRENVENIAQDLQIPIVPIIGTGTLHDMVSLVQNGFDSRWGNFEAEGIIARPKVELFTRGGSRIITKIKCKDFK